MNQSFKIALPRNALMKYTGFVSRFLVAHILCFMMAIGTATSQELSEYDIKAAFVLNFLRYTEGQGADHQKPDLRVCIAASDAIYLTFTQLQNKQIEQKTVTVKKISLSDNQIEFCDLIYISSTSSLIFEGLISKLNDYPVLTVGETEDFLQRGGMIRFFTEENKIRFEVNSKRVEDHGIHLSSKLLSLARIYDE